MFDLKSIQNVFTDYDDSVTGDSFRDPMGMQVIWSYFGQKIFGNLITSISNDIRNFTIALFHHSIIKAVQEETASASIPENSRTPFVPKTHLISKPPSSYSWKICLSTRYIIWSMMKRNFSIPLICLVLQALWGNGIFRKAIPSFSCTRTPEYW